MTTNKEMEEIKPQYCDGCGQEEVEDLPMTVSCSNCDYEWRKSERQALISEIEEKVDEAPNNIYVEYDEGAKDLRKEVKYIRVSDVKQILTNLREERDGR